MDRVSPTTRWPWCARLAYRLRPVVPRAVCRRSLPSHQLEQIDAPTTLIWGRHDLATPLHVAETASALHGWPLYVIEGAGDDPPLDQPGPFVEAILAAGGYLRERGSEPREYDVIVVGARCAGSPTAMLLARRGHRVLLVDRATFPSDTVSTHLVHPPGVAALRRWGVLDEVLGTGCPPVHTYAFDFGPFARRRARHRGLAGRVRAPPYRARRDPARSGCSSRRRDPRGIHRHRARHRGRTGRGDPGPWPDGAPSPTGPPWSSAQTAALGRRRSRRPEPTWRSRGCWSATTGTGATCRWMAVRGVQPAGRAFAAGRPARPDRRDRRLALRRVRPEPSRRQRPTTCAVRSRTQLSRADQQRLPRDEAGRCRGAQLLPQAIRTGGPWSAMPAT